jgi:Uma2 family endonuclease
MSLITYEDSLTMPENKLEEILNGESRIMPPATFFHAYLLRKLFRILEAQLDADEYILFGGGAGLGIERAPLTCRIPDLMVFQTESLRRSRAQSAANDPYIWTAPDLLVECLSASNRKSSVRDLLSDYAQIAAPEVWLLDPVAPQFTAYRYESGALRESQSISQGVVTAQLLPNVTVNLADLWSAYAGI